jgi:hypothetical protein
MVMKPYTNWANYETWNVANHMHNNKQIYGWAVDFMKTYVGDNAFFDFVTDYGLISTSDGVLYGDSVISNAEINEMMKGLIEL